MSQLALQPDILGLQTAVPLVPGSEHGQEGRSTRHAGYQVGQKKRKQVEEVSGSTAIDSAEKVLLAL
jgi:hypothetical protein